MILNFPEIEVNTLKKVEGESFRIGDLRVVIDILRSKMYSNAIYTICQEISSNARDANREIGRESTPIEITLPNFSSDKFIVKDSGPGISPSRMMDVFIQYGRSTKRADNGQTGGFGLGAKSPFAYVDQFVITTVSSENGVNTRRSYIAYIDESKIGSITLTNEQVTTDPTGTEISLSVKNGDYEKFAVAISNVTKWWNPRPIIRGVVIKYVDSTLAFEGPGWKCFDKQHYSDNRKIIAVLDGIPYTVNQSNISTLNTYNSFINKLTSNFNLYLFFESGDLSVTANREELDYQDQDTVDALTEQLNAVEADLTERWNKHFLKCTSFKEACVLFNDNSSKLRCIFQSGKWNNIRIDGKISQAKFIQINEEKKSFTISKAWDRSLTKDISIDQILIVHDDIDEASRGRINRLIKAYPGKKIFITVYHEDVADILLSSIPYEKKEKKPSTQEKSRVHIITDSEEKTKDIPVTSNGYYVWNTSKGLRIGNFSKHVSIDQARQLMKLVGVDKIYAIRSVEKFPSMISFQSKIEEKAKKLFQSKTLKRYIKGKGFTIQYGKDIASMVTDKNGIFSRIYAISNNDTIPVEYSQFQTLTPHCSISFDVDRKGDYYLGLLRKAYPLVSWEAWYQQDSKDIAAYINMMDYVRSMKKK